MGFYYNNGGGQGGGLFSSLPRVTKNLIVTNICVFALTWLAERMANTDIITRQFALFYPGSQLFRIWQPLTYMFLHGGFWHIFFNMYTLFFFGPVVERMIGEKKFLLFYLVCGLGAAACQIGVQALQAASYMDAIANGNSSAANMYMMLKMTPTVGASGAIYGLLIAYAMLFPTSRMTLLFPPVTLSAKWMVIIFAGIELMTGMGSVTGGYSSNVAHFAHLGGMLIGYILIWYWRKNGKLFDREYF